MKTYYTFNRKSEAVATPDTLHALTREIRATDLSIKATEDKIAIEVKKANDLRDYRLQLLAKKDRIQKKLKTPLMHEAHALQLIDGAIS